jgi:hypothetical protein
MRALVGLFQNPDRHVRVERRRFAFVVAVAIYWLSVSTAR